MAALRRILSLRPGRFVLLLCGAALLAGGLAGAHQVETGPGLQWDSIEYISVARSLLDGEGFTRFFGGTLKARPPFYPLLLAGGSLGRFDPHHVAGSLNAVIAALTVIIVGRWLRRRLESPLLLAGGCLAVALAPPLLWMAYWALSETAFILLATLALLYINEYLDSRRRSALAAAAALTALAVLTRYLGVAVMAAGVMLLLFQRDAALSARIKQTAVYALIAAVPAALWILRTYLLTGMPIGARDDIRYSAADIWNEAVGVLEHGGFLLTLGAPASAILIAGGMTLTAAAVVVGWAFIRSQRSMTGWAGGRPFLVFTGFALSYAVILVIALLSGTTSSWGDPRYLIPLYLPLLIAALLAMDRALSYSRSRANTNAGPDAGASHTGFVRVAHYWRRGGVPLAAALLLTLAIAGQSLMTARSIALANSDYYQTYQSARWTNSAALQYIREQSLAGVLFSNAAAAAYIHTDLDARHRYLPCGVGALRQRLSAASNDGGDNAVHIIWFPDWGSPGCDPAGDGYDGGKLRAMPELETVHEAADGVILRFNPNYSDRNG